VYVYDFYKFVVVLFVLVFLFVLFEVKPIYQYKTENHKYPFRIKNYDDEDNLWELIGNIKLKKNKEI